MKIIFVFFLLASCYVNGQPQSDVPRPEYINSPQVWVKATNKSYDLAVEKASFVNKVSGANFIPGGGLFSKNKFGFSLDGEHSSVNVGTADSTFIIVKINPDQNPTGYLRLFLLDVNQKKSRREAVIGYMQSGSIVYTTDKEVVYELKKLDRGIFMLKFGGHLSGEFAMQIGTYVNGLNATMPSYFTFSVR